MITENDLMEAIAECQGARNPNSSTCIKLAAYYTILNQMYPKSEIPDEISYPVYSTSPGTSYSSDTEFGRVVRDKDINEVLEVMDELLSTIQVMYPKLYNGVMRRLK